MQNNVFLYMIWSSFTLSGIFNYMRKVSDYMCESYQIFMEREERRNSRHHQYRQSGPQHGQGRQSQSGPQQVPPSQAGPSEIEKEIDIDIDIVAIARQMGFTPNATKREINIIFRQLSLKYHPDKSDLPYEKSKRIQQNLNAYRDLCLNK
jgi:hypothetical protein